MGPLLRKQAGPVGRGEADGWIGLTDGGNGLERFLHINFPGDLVVLLDFWHASAYWAGLAHLLHPNNAGESKRLHKEWSPTYEA